MTCPYVSVVVAAFNAGDYIERCLDSLRSQTLNNIEVIVVDDGSVDASSYIMDAFADSDDRFHVYHIPHHGVSYARQLALEKATGEYIIQTDADDWVDSNLMQLLYDKSQDEGADLVMCDMMEHFPNEVLIRNYSPQSLDQDVFFNDYLLVKYGSGLCNKLVRRSILVENDIRFDPTMTTSEDFYVLCQLFEHPLAISYVPNVYYHYDKVANPHSISRRKIPYSHLVSQIKCVDYLVSHFDPVKFSEGIECRKINVKRLMWDSGFIQKWMVDKYSEVNHIFEKGQANRLGLYSEQYYVFSGHYYFGIMLWYYRRLKRSVKKLAVHFI